MGTSSRNVGLDSLRGLAVVAVLAYHLGFVSGGFLGVDIFFVLSGYLVTALALKEREGTGSFGVKAFWWRRFKRLAPAVFVTVPTVLVAAYLMGWERSNFRSLGWDATATLGWWANWRQIFGADTGYWGGAPSLFRHSWSLSVEEQFYLLWPLLMMAAFGVVHLVKRGTARKAVGGVAALVALASALWMLTLAHRLPLHGFNRVYLGTDTRVFAPAIGALLAVLWPMKPRSLSVPSQLVLRTSALGAGAWLLWLMLRVEVYSASLYRGGLLIVVAVLAAVLLVGFSTLHRIDPLTNWLGRRSYGIYLWSWPTQLLISDRWPYTSRGLVALATVVVSFALAEVSWHLVEAPVQRGEGWAKPIVLRNRVGAGLVLGSIAAVWLVFSTAAPRFGLPQVSGDLLSVNTAAAEVFSEDDLNGQIAGLPPNAGQLEEVAGSSTDAPRDEASTAKDGEVVILYGDSVALTMYEYFPWGDVPEGLISVLARADLGCGLLGPLQYEFPYVGIYAAVTRERCVNNDAFLAGGLALHPDVMVLLPGAWEWSEVRAPNGEMIDGQSNEMAELLVARIHDLASRAEEVGARTVIIPWACPGPRDDLPQRREASYINWINDVFAQAADPAYVPQGLRVALAPLPPGICNDDEPSGRPTAEKNGAFKDEVHVRDAEGGWWAWHQWLGPSVVATRPL